MAKMLLLVATVVAAIASASGANPESHIQRYVVNGKLVPQGVMEQAQAAAMSALAGQQTVADDRSLLLTKTIAKGIALKKIKKKKKNKHFKSPLKALPFLPLLGIGGAAAAAAAASTAAKGAAASAPAFLGPTAFTSPLPQNLDIPVWKVHKYNGIDIRPVRLSDLPLPPPSESDFPQVIANPPKEVFVPEPHENFPTPADTIVFPETPKEIVPTYGVPAQTYGVPAQTYGVPAQTYGPPIQTYGFQSSPGQPQGFFVSSQSYSTPSQQGYQASSSSSGNDGPTQTVEEAATPESLEALSNLGALTDLIPGGGDSSGSLAGLFGGQNRGIQPLSFFNRLIRGPQPDAQTLDTPATGIVYRQPSQTAIQNLLGRIPLISSLTNFGSNPSTHASLPLLPELPDVPDIQNVRGPSVIIPQIPRVRLPTTYVVSGSPYVSIRYPRPQQGPSAESVSPVPKEAPVIEPVKPEPSYPLALEQPKPQPQYNLINSYGQPLQTGFLVTPVIANSAAPQYSAPSYPAAVPASSYGLPGGDSFVAASELDPATSTDCADGKCREGVLKVAVPEGVTRAVKSSVAAPSPVFRKEENAQVAKTSPEDMARYLDPQHPSATKTQSAMPVASKVDAQPSTATEENDS